MLLLIGGTAALLASGVALSALIGASVLLCRGKSPKKPH
jgi:hypothetical protein